MWKRDLGRKRLCRSQGIPPRHPGRPKQSEVARRSLSRTVQPVWPSLNTHLGKPSCPVAALNSTAPRYVSFAIHLRANLLRPASAFDAILICATSDDIRPDISLSDGPAGLRRAVASLWPTVTDVAHDFSAVADLQGLPHPRSRPHVHQTLCDPSVACEVRQDHAGASSSTTPEPRLGCGYITQPCKWRRSLWALARTHARLRHSVQPCVRQSDQTWHPHMSIPLPGPLWEGLGAWR